MGAASLHHSEFVLDVLKLKPVSLQRKWIDAFRLNQAQQTAHPF